METTAYTVPGLEFCFKDFAEDFLEVKPETGLELELELDRMGGSSVKRSS